MKKGSEKAKKKTFIREFIEIVSTQIFHYDLMKFDWVRSEIVIKRNFAKISDDNVIDPSATSISEFCDAISAKTS